MAKILANYLNVVIEKLISLNQGALVKGRWIAENTMIAQEVVHRVKMHKGKKGLMVMKIDMKKAYDRMGWIFLIQVLKAWGFCDHFQQLIYSCINSIIFNLLLNENVSEKFKPNGGLHQGDPLSLLLFILGSEVLSRMLGKKEVEGRLHGIKMDMNAPPVSHLMYAYDFLMMARVDRQKVEAFRKCFYTYCLWSGQEANVDKSNIFFSKYTRGELKRRF